MRSTRILLVLAGLCACGVPQRAPSPVPAPPAPAAGASSWRLVPPAEWPRIRDEMTKDSLAAAAAQSSAALQVSAPTGRWSIGGRSVDAGEFKASLVELARAVSESSDEEALNARLRRDFELYQSIGSDKNGKVVFSAYYQPTLKASLKRTKRFKYPLYRKPKDLVSVDWSAFGVAGEPLLGRVAKGRLVPYPSRRDIDLLGRLAGKGLELAWLDNAFDRLTLHVEGSGLLELPDGRRMLSRFGGTNGLPFKSVGSVIVGAGIISKSEITHDNLGRYLKDHPEGEGWVLSQNPRYTFFELAPLEGEPPGTMGRPLTPGRSIAIDPKLVALGAMAYLETPMPLADAKGRFYGVFPTSRFVLCQDTGGAILGPGRVDIFVGHGPQASVMAANQWTEGRLFILLKKGGA